MRIYMRFPKGKAKALTLSYDDGPEQDIRLIEIMKKNGLKGTFNINSGLYAPEGTVYPKEQLKGRRMSRSQAREVYKNSGMEVAVHGCTHPYLEQLPVNLCMREVLQDRMNLEEEYDVIVRGMAYPFGTYNDSVVECLKQCGIVYSRTIISTEKFNIPEDWLRMPATCHHNNPRLMELARRFAEEDVKKGPKLFYLWGHSFEFDVNDNWNVIEEFAEYIGGRDDIWYASNIEIYDYIAAYKQLVFSMDGRKIYNPTNTAVCLLVDSEVCQVNPGETIIVGISDKT